MASASPVPIVAASPVAPLEVLGALARRREQLWIVVPQELGSEHHLEVRAVSERELDVCEADLGEVPAARCGGLAESFRQQSVALGSKGGQ
jgi:hypothetical protein